MVIFKLAELIELSLVILESCGCFRTRLPLGGGPIEQLGIVFATASSTYFIDAHCASESMLHVPRLKSPTSLRRAWAVWERCFRVIVPIASLPRRLGARRAPCYAGYETAWCARSVYGLLGRGRGRRSGVGTLGFFEGSGQGIGAVGEECCVGADGDKTVAPLDIATGVGLHCCQDPGGFAGPGESLGCVV